MAIKKFYDSLAVSFVPEIYRAGYQAYRRMAPALAGKISAMREFITQLEASKKIVAGIAKKVGKKNPLLADFQQHTSLLLVINATRNCSAQSWLQRKKKLLKVIKERLPFYRDFEEMRYHEIDHLIELAQYHLAHGLNVKNNEPDTSTGDADVSLDKIGILERPNSSPVHGSHVAGIIGAVRNKWNRYGWHCR